MNSSLFSLGCIRFQVLLMEVTILNPFKSFVIEVTRVRLSLPPPFFVTSHSSSTQSSRCFFLVFVVVNWSFDSGDSAGKSPSSTISSYKKLAQSYPKPQISLNHEVTFPFPLLPLSLLIGP